MRDGERTGERERVGKREGGSCIRCGLRFPLADIRVHSPHVLMVRNSADGDKKFQLDQKRPVIDGCPSSDSYDIPKQSSSVDETRKIKYIASAATRMERRRVRCNWLRVLSKPCHYSFFES